MIFIVEEIIIVFISTVKNIFTLANGYKYASKFRAKTALMMTGFFSTFSFMSCAKALMLQGKHCASSFAINVLQQSGSFLEAVGSRLSNLYWYKLNKL